MASKQNSEFNYRTQCIGETLWKKIETLNGFLESRKLACAMRGLGKKQLEAKHLEFKYAKENNQPEYLIKKLECELLEADLYSKQGDDCLDLADQEVIMLEKILAEYYELAEPTRIIGYTDEQMYEINAANEFTATIGKDIYAEILACGAPSPSKLRNAMSNVHTWNALKIAGFIPQDAVLLEANNDPLKIELKPMDKTLDCIKQPTILNLTIK